MLWKITNLLIYVLFMHSADEIFASQVTIYIIFGPRRVFHMRTVLNVFMCDIICAIVYIRKWMSYIVSSSLEARPCDDSSRFLSVLLSTYCHMFRLGLGQRPISGPHHSNLFITCHSHSPLSTCKVCRGKSSFAHFSARVGRTCRSLRFVMPFCTVW